MSARLPCGNQMFPTVGDDGLIKIIMGNYFIPIEIPYREKFELDNHTCINHTNIICYLENAEHKIVIRRDGSLTRYTKDNIVIGNIHISLPEEIFKITIIPKGIVKVYGNSVLNSNYILPDNSIVLSTPLDEGFYDVPIQFNKEYMDRLNSYLTFEPIITIVDGDLYLSDANNNPQSLMFTEYVPFVCGRVIR